MFFLKTATQLRDKKKRRLLFSFFNCCVKRCDFKVKETRRKGHLYVSRTVYCTLQSECVSADEALQNISV